MKEITTLKSLSLNHTDLDDNGLAALAVLSKSKDLQVRLNGTEITDAGLLHLHRMTNVTELRIENTKVTEAGVVKLQKALPKCRIKY